MRKPAAGLGWGAAIGAASGVLAAYTSVLAFAVLTYISEVQDTNQLPLFVVGIGIYGLFGSLYGAAIGAMVGAVAGVVLGLFRKDRFAPYVAGSIVLIPFIVGPKLVGDRVDTIEYVLTAFCTAVAYAAIGWFAGKAFEKKLGEVDFADEARGVSEDEQAGITRLVELSD